MLQGKLAVASFPLSVSMFLFQNRAHGTSSKYKLATTNHHGQDFSIGKLATTSFLLSLFHTPGSRGRNLQATRCVLGGKSRVKAVTLFLTPPFRLNS